MAIGANLWKRSARSVRATPFQPIKHLKMAKKIVWTDQAKGDVRDIDRETAIDLLHRLARFLATEEGDETAD